MKIKYNILWVENERDWLDSIVEEIKDFIEDFGFRFYYDIAESRSEIGNYNKYDLILMDLNLASEPTGDEIIQDIRKMNIYTDVVFYSADVETIRKKGRERELEGVYFSGRNTQRFTDKVKQVIKNTIRKTQDINNIRGLVMAEVSELDAMMGEILSVFLRKEEMLKKFHGKVTKDREDAIHRSLEKANCAKDCQLNWRRLSVDEIINKIDASQKARGLNMILEDIQAKGSGQIYSSPNDKSFYGNYYEDIIEMRNNLAHCQSEEGPNGDILKTKKGDVEFSVDTFTCIRKKIMEYHKLFEEILSKCS